MNNKVNKTSFTKSVSLFIAKLIYKIRTLSFVKTILFFYLFITIIGALILWWPQTQTGFIKWDPITGEKTKGTMSFVDSLFTAASAFSDTGLVTNSSAVVYNQFGQGVLAILIFIGGIGWFALKVYIFNIIFGKPLSHKAREALAAERGSVRIGVSRNLIRIAVTTLLVIFFIASIVLSIVFYYTDISGNITKLDNQILSSDKLLYENPYGNPVVALRYGMFHTVSAINNAGFDIMGNNSLSPYYNVISIQIIFIVLFVIGGLGYPVIFDVYNYVVKRYKGEKFRFSLFTKLSMSAYVAVAVIGVGATYAIEVGGNGKFWQDTNDKYGSVGKKSLAIFFNSMSTRNAGFSTVDIHDFSRATLIIYIIMMFIGSAPSSTAGGIRTTTIAINVLGIWSLLRGRKYVYAFGYKIDQNTVNRSFVVFVTSIIILVLGTLISVSSLDIMGGNIPTLGKQVQKAGIDIETIRNMRTFNFTEVVFEVGSAFGTTGLSAGITPLLSLSSKLTLIMIMLIGQLGVSSAILIWGSRKRTDNHVTRINQDVSIG